MIFPQDKITGATGGTAHTQRSQPDRSRV